MDIFIPNPFLQDPTSSWQIVYVSLSTYAFAFLASACVDLVLSGNKPQDSSEKVSNALLVFAIAAVVVGSVLAFAVFVTAPRDDLASLTKGLSFGCVFLALFLWWIANYDNAMLMEKDPPFNAPTGGELSNELAGTKPDDIKF